MTSLRRRLRPVAAALGRARSKINARGVLAVSGMGSIVIFVAHIWGPLVWLAAGIFLIVAASAPARRMNE